MEDLEMNRFARSTPVSTQRPVSPAAARKVFCAAAVAAVAALAPAAHAVDGTYINATTGGSWSVPGNWSGGNVATGQDGIANFNTLDLAADNTVHLDTARTIGRLNFADAGSVGASTVNPNKWILDNNATAANVLTLSTSTGVPTIDVAGRNDSVGLDVGDARVTQVTISGVVAGTQGFNKTGPGALLLTAANPSLSGPISLSSGGILEVSNGALGTPSGVTINSNVAGSRGTALHLRGYNVIGVPLTVSVTTPTARSTLRAPAGSGTSSWTGDITLKGDGSVDTQSFSVYADAPLSINNVTADSTFKGLFLPRGGASAADVGNLNGTINIPNSRFIKTESGTWILNSTGNVWKKTEVAVGMLKLGVNDAAPTNVGLLMGQANSSATFDLNGKNQTVAGLAVAASSTNTITNSFSATPATFTVNNTTLTDSFGDGNDIVTGALNLVKSGVGKLVLNGPNTYTGTTTVNDGTLSVATTGRLGATTSVADVTVADAGLLDLQVVAISDTASVFLTSSDLAAEMNLGFTGTDTIASLFLNGTPMGLGTYGSSTSGATNAGLANPNDFFSGNGTLTVTLVPEPASLTLAGLGALGLLARRRRPA
jgi:fibronectin-binding autotransporter adhesin